MNSLPTKTERAWTRCKCNPQHTVVPISPSVASVPSVACVALTPTGNSNRRRRPPGPPKPTESAEEKLASRRRRAREEMEDRAAAAGSGEGGRDREDALWKGLAPLSSQSIEERRALRSEYAGVRAMIREGTCAPRFSIVFCDLAEVGYAISYARSRVTG